MNEYIKRDDAIELVNSYINRAEIYMENDGYYEAQFDGFQEYRNELFNLENIELKRGRWIDNEDELPKTCSNCGMVCTSITLNTDMQTTANWNYCPECGSDMRGR